MDRPRLSRPGARPLRACGRRGVPAWAAAWCIGFLPPVASAGEAWEYGAYIDLSYADDLDGSGRVPWRGKLTTNRLNQFDPNLGMAYIRKPATADSPWGFELGG